MELEPVPVETAAGRIAVHVLNSGRPTVLWHGLWVDGGEWGYAIPALLPGRRLLVVDGPGWGRSGALRARITGADVVRAAAQVVEALDGGPVDWVGAGWGGRVGLALAVARPGLVRSVVAVAADPAPMPAAERRRVRRVLAGLRVVGPVGGIGRAIVDDQLAPASRTEPRTVGAVLDALLLAGRLQAARAVERFEVRRPDLTGLLPRITAPVLLVATDDDGPFPERVAAAAAALGPLARTAVVPGARALVPLDQPGPLASAITAFWADLAAP